MLFCPQAPGTDKLFSAGSSLAMAQAVSRYWASTRRLARDSGM